MGQRGKIPDPTKIRELKGRPAATRRPLPLNEPKYVEGIPDQPEDMTPGARAVWDNLVSEMAISGVLRRVDGMALAQLCEDEALLKELRAGLEAMIRDMTAHAVKTGRKPFGNCAVEIAKTTAGQRIHRAIRETNAQIIVQRREFGLTPASNSRVEATGPVGGRRYDPLETALCG